MAPLPHGKQIQTPINSAFGATTGRAAKLISLIFSIAAVWCVPFCLGCSVPWVYVINFKRKKKKLSTALTHTVKLASWKSLKYGFVTGFYISFKKYSVKVSTPPAHPLPVSRLQTLSEPTNPLTRSHLNVDLLCSLGFTWHLHGCGKRPQGWRTRLSPSEHRTAPRPDRNAWPPP